MVVQGTVEAEELEAARASLTTKHLTVLSMTPSKDVELPRAAPLDLSPAWKPTPEQVPYAPLSSAPTPQTAYYPLVETFRLYAGWLLAWYFLIFALGSYQLTRSLPFRVPYVDDLFTSPLVTDFSAAAFLFLLLTDLHRRIGRGIIKGLVLCVVGFFAFAFLYENI